MCCVNCWATPGLGKSRDTLTLATLEQRLDRLRDDAAIPNAMLARVCQAMLPELYGTPPASQRGTHTTPGSCSRQKRYAGRVARGRQVFHPADLTND